MRLVMATHNQKKLREMRAILTDLGIEVVSQQELGLDLEPEEDGQTFEANARIKAMAVMRATGLAAVADDSGLAVEALDGRPGVYSARYGGLDTDEARNRLLLREMGGVENRRCSFVSAVCCVFPDGREITVRGECPGRLLTEPRGEGGFGYDPLFYMPEIGMTMAEMSPEVKNNVSHRARAMVKLKRELEKLLRPEAQATL